MALSIRIVLTSLGVNAGPSFNLYSDNDGYVTAFDSATQTQLLAGYTSTLVPNNTLRIKVVSTGTCGTTIYIPITGVPSPTPSVTPSITKTPSLTPSKTPSLTPSRSAPKVNFPTPTPGGEGTPSPGGGGGNTCLAYNTPIIMADNTIKFIQDIKSDDKVLSIKSKDIFFDTNTFETSFANITNISQMLVHNVISINKGLLITSDSHINVIKRNDTWSFKTSKELLVGDIVIDINKNEIEITSVDNLNESQLVYNITVDNEHLYFANNILTHNKTQPGRCCGTTAGNCNFYNVTNCISLGLINCSGC
jgi:hypothetical protein